MINKKRKIKIITSFSLVFLFALLMFFLFYGDNYYLLKSLFLEEHTNEELKEKLKDFGIKGYITIISLAMLQVVSSVLPAEPVQVVAGLAFGFPLGLALCTVGVFLGNTVIYILYKVYGEKIRDYFVSNLHFDFDKAKSSKGAFAVALIFILYFLPAIPYGMICFLGASLGMKFHKYITVTTLCSIPSVCIGVGLGHMAISSSWILSLIVFVVLVVILIIVAVKKDAIFKKVNSFLDRPPYSSKTVVKKYNRHMLDIPNIVARIIFFFKGVKVKYTNKLGRDVEGPCIVLCNHGSFIDFAYAGTLLRKKSPNFIVARLYFYKKLFGNFLRKFGCFPKSMFAQDIESVKNCIRVLKAGGVLAMMPEARLSTAGKFEDIQEGTYTFLKQAGVTVYTVKICGDYLAKPKWGTALRRGSLIEAELDLLYTKEQLMELSSEQIKDGVEQRLYYNEFEWLKTKPNLKYRCKDIAVGLENILIICPKCKQKYTIHTNHNEIHCKCCGKLTSVDNRYQFDTDFVFDNHLSWYEWQKAEIKEEVLANSNYSLSSNTEFYLPSENGKTLLDKVGCGVCTLDKNGLTYRGTSNGEDIELNFPIKSTYRLLFGAGENFEVYVGNKIHYFRPEILSSSVHWYIASEILYNLSLNS